MFLIRAACCVQGLSPIRTRSWKDDDASSLSTERAALPERRGTAAQAGAALLQRWDAFVRATVHTTAFFADLLGVACGAGAA